MENKIFNIDKNSINKHIFHETIVYLYQWIEDRFWFFRLLLFNKLFVFVWCDNNRVRDVEWVVLVDLPEL